MFLEVVAHARDVCGDFDAVRETDTGDLADSRVRLLRGLSRDFHAYTTLEWSREKHRSVLDRVECARKCDRLRLPLEALTMTLCELINCWHV